MEPGVNQAKLHIPCCAKLVPYKKYRKIDSVLGLFWKQGTEGERGEKERNCDGTGAVVSHIATQFRNHCEVNGTAEK